MECCPGALVARQPNRVGGNRHRDAEKRIPGARIFRVAAAAEQCVHAGRRCGTGARSKWRRRLDLCQLSATRRVSDCRCDCFCPRPPWSTTMINEIGPSDHRASGHLKSKAFDLRSPDGPIDPHHHDPGVNHDPTPSSDRSNRPSASSHLDGNLPSPHAAASRWT